MGFAEKESSQSNDTGDELERLKKESLAMIKLLKNLDKQVQDLAHQNEILARQALLCGFDVKVLEPPAPKRRKASGKKGNTPVSLEKSVE